MNCEQFGEYISALCDGDRIPPEAAQHIGTCRACREQLNQYAAIGVELRRLASLAQQATPEAVNWKERGKSKSPWWKKGMTTMRVPRLAFGVMLIAIVALSGGLVMVRARAGSVSGPFLQLKYTLVSAGRTSICMMKTDNDPKSNFCNLVDHGREGLLLLNVRFIAKAGDVAEIGIRTKYMPGSGDTQIEYNEGQFKDVPEKQLMLEPGEKQQLEVAGLGTIELEGKYLDHMPSLAYRPQERLDPGPKEFRVVSPVLLRDNEAIANVDGNSIDTGDADATLMFYIPGEGRYLFSILPFEGAVEGNVHLGQIKFSLEGHDYLLLTSMPSTLSEHVWVKHDADFKPSERMVRQSDARDDRPMFLVRSLSRLEQPRIEH